MWFASPLLGSLPIASGNYLKYFASIFYSHSRYLIFKSSVYFIRVENHRTFIKILTDLTFMIHRHLLLETNNYTCHYACFKNKTKNNTRPKAVLEPFSLQKFQPNLFTKFRDKHMYGRTQTFFIIRALCRHCGANTDPLLLRFVIRISNKSKQYITEYYLCK